MESKIGRPKKGPNRVVTSISLYDDTVLMVESERLGKESTADVINRIIREYSKMKHKSEVIGMASVNEESEFMSDFVSGYLNIRTRSRPKTEIDYDNYKRSYVRYHPHYKDLFKNMSENEIKNWMDEKYNVRW